MKVNQLTAVYMQIYVPGICTIFVLDSFIGQPLYGYYVVWVDEFDPDDIEGTLMSTPIHFEGPYDTQEEAETQAKQMSRDLQDVDNPGFPF